MANNEFTLDRLRGMLRTVAGDEENANLDADILDMCFEDLGYDSIAMLEASRCIELEYGIVLADSTVTDAETPRALLAIVNEGLGAKPVL